MCVCVCVYMCVCVCVYMCVCIYIAIAYQKKKLKEGSFLA